MRCSLCILYFYTRGSSSATSSGVFSSFAFLLSHAVASTQVSLSLLDGKMANLNQLTILYRRVEVGGNEGTEGKKCISFKTALHGRPDSSVGIAGARI